MYEQRSVDSYDNAYIPTSGQHWSSLCVNISFCCIQLASIITACIIMAFTYNFDYIIATTILIIICGFILLFYIIISIIYGINKLCCNRSGRLIISYLPFIWNTVCIWFCSQFLTLFLLSTILIVTNHPYWKGPFEDIFLSSDTMNNNDDITVRPYFQTTEYSANILRPNTVNEIQDIIIEYGLNSDHKIRAIGSAHSSSPLFTNDILISLDNFANITINTDNLTVIVGAGAVLQNVEDYLFEFGYVLTGFGSVQQQRMGGMLGTGVYGIYGAMNKYVVTVWLIDGNGNNLMLTKQYNSSWIAALKVNMGLLGIIYQIEFIIEPTFNVQKSIESVSIDTFEQLSISEFKSFFFPSSNDTLGTRLRITPFIGFEMEIFKNTTDTVNIIDYQQNEEIRSLINNVLLTLQCLIPETNILCDPMEWNQDTKYIENNVYSAKSSLMTDAIFHGGFIYAIPFEHCHDALIDLNEMLIKWFPSTANIIPMTQNHDYGYLSYSIDTDVCMIEIYPNLCSEDRLKLAQDFEINLLLKYNGTSHWGKQLMIINDIDIDQLNTFWNGFDAFENVRNLADPNDIFLNDYLSKFFNGNLTENVEITYPLIDDYRKNSRCWESLGWFGIAICFIVSIIVGGFILNYKGNEYLLLYNNDNKCKFMITLLFIIITECVLGLILFFVIGMTVE